MAQRINMALYRMASVSVLALAAALTACSSTPDVTPKASPPNQATSASPKPVELPIELNAAVPFDALEPAIGELASLESEDETVEQPSFQRPLLTLDHSDNTPLPDALPKGAEVGYLVIDIERGVPITQYRADHAQIPASTAKLATAVGALELLGPDHRFLTELRATGPVKNGILKGDLMLVGGGDPVLDIPDLLPLIEGLMTSRIRGIEGRFLIDDTLLPRFTEIEATQPTEAAYNPGLGALSLAFNRVKVQWQKRGELDVSTLPMLDEAAFEAASSKRLPPSGVQLKAFDGDQAVWQLVDKGARRSKRSLPVKDPGLHAGLVFQDLAKLYGIDLPAPERLEVSQTGRLIAIHQSKPLRELVRDMLWYSNNLVAEMIGLSAAATLDRDSDSLETSAGLLMSALNERVADVSFENAALANHSGLSSQSRLTPEQLVGILRHGWQEGMLSTLLPGSGWSGTLARRFNGPDQAFRIWAKTGSINYVSALGGYLLSPSHSPVAFVIMISDEKARAAYDAEPRRTRSSEKRADLWQRKAEKAMEQIVERWLNPEIEPSSESLVAMTEAGKERLQR